MSNIDIKLLNDDLVVLNDLSINGNFFAKSGHKNKTGITGEIRIWSTGVAPHGWLLCDGSLYNKNDYIDLSNVIGINFGGNTTTFNVPDLRRRIPVGSMGNNNTSLSSTNRSTSRNLYQTGGEQNTTLSEISIHTHNIASHTHNIETHSHNTPTDYTNHNHSINNNHSHTRGLQGINLDHNHEVTTHTHQMDNHSHQMTHNHEINFSQFNQLASGNQASKQLIRVDQERFEGRGNGGTEYSKTNQTVGFKEKAKEINVTSATTGWQTGNTVHNVTQQQTDGGDWGTTNSNWDAALDATSVPLEQNSVITTTNQGADTSTQGTNSTELAETGGESNHNNECPYIVLNYIIKI